MKVLFIPSYKDIFQGGKPDILSLLHDIPSKVIIALMSIINSELFLNGKEKHSQIKIFDYVTRRFQENDYQIIRNKIERFYEKMRLENGHNIEIGLFDIRYTIEFISRELLNYRDFDFEVTTPEQELNIYKAYLLIVNEIDEKEAILLSKVNPEKDIHGIKHLLCEYSGAK
jgi:hypothetical protein